MTNGSLSGASHNGRASGRGSVKADVGRADKKPVRAVLPVEQS